ncbi:MAG: hypothetical protein ACRD0P_07455 [Stackebrandtia sp.]
MRQKPLKSSRQARPVTITATIGVGIGVIGGSGFALALNDLARWVVLIAAAAAIITGWTEGRHIAATKRQVMALGMVPRPRTPAEDNPQFYAGS